MTPQTTSPSEAEIKDWVTRLDTPEPDSTDKAVQLKAVELAASDVHNRSLIDWRRVRSAIEHENNLVNHRVTWLLLSQGALLATFSNLFSKWVEYSASVPGAVAPLPANTTAAGVGPYLPIALVLLAVLGLAISMNLRLSLRNAALQIFRLTVWWHSGPLSILCGTQTDPLSLSRLVSTYKRKSADSHATASLAYNELHRIHPPLHLNYDVEWRLSDKPRQRWQRFFSIEALPLYFLFTWVVALAGLIAQVFRPDRDDLARWATWIATGAAIVLILVAVLFVRVTITIRRPNKSN